MRKVFFLLLALSLFSQAELRAQAVVSIANQTACTGDTAYVGVQLNTSGQAIGAASLVIQWDSTVTFRGMANILPAFAPDFSWQQQGRSVRISWFSTTPRTINGLWFQLKFTGNSAALNFSTLPGENELANAQGTPLSGTQFQGGQLTFTAGNPIQISSQPRDTLVATGASVSFRVIASNVTNFQWERSTDGGNLWTLLSNDATYSNTGTAILGVANVSTSMQGHRFRARMSNSCQSLVLSQAAVLSVAQPGSTQLNLITTPVCGQDTAVVNVQAAAAINGVGAVSLVLLFDSSQAQLVQISSPLSGLANGLLTNRVGNRLFVSWFNTTGINIPQGTFLQIRFRQVTGGSLTFDQSQTGNNEISNLSGQPFPLTFGSVQLQSAPTPTATLSPSGTVNSCTGSGPLLTANTGTGLTYRWLRNNLPISGATAASFQTVQAGAYRVIVTNAAGCFDTSAATTVDFSAAINAQIGPAGPTTFCSGGSVLLNATSGTGFSYSWLRNGVVISGATNASYTATLAGSYRVRIQNSANCVDTSAAVTVNVVTAPGATITAVGSTTFCAGGSVTLNANTGTGLTYAWLRNGVVVSSATTASIQAVLAGDYRVIVSAGSCADTSGVTTVIVNPSPSAQITPAGPTTFCTGGSVVLNANTGTGFSYSWFRNGALISGANTANITATLAGSYRVRIVNSSGCFDTSAAVVVVVNTRPSAVITPAGPTSFCPGGSVTLNATTGTGFTYVWQRNGNTITGANTASIQATLAGDYRVIITATGGCADTSGNTTVSVLTAPVAQITAGGPTTFCTGDSVLLNANTGTGLTYLWLRNDTVIVGETAATLVARNTGDYKVRVTNAAGCQSTSAAIAISATPLPPAPALSVSTDTIFSSISTGLLWFRNGLLLAGLTDSFLVVTQPGHYTALRIVGNCQSDSSNVILIDNVSVEHLNKLQFRLYPNPTSGQFYVDFATDGLKSTELRIYSLQGKLMQFLSLPAGSLESRFELELHTAAGMYLIELVQGDKKGYQRLVLKN